MDGLLNKLYEIIENKNDNKPVLLYGTGIEHLERDQIAFIEEELMKSSGVTVWCISAKQLHKQMEEDSQNKTTGVRHEYFWGKLTFIDEIEHFVKEENTACQVDLIILLYLLKKQGKIVIATSKVPPQELGIMKNYFIDGDVYVY